MSRVRTRKGAFARLDLDNGPGIEVTAEFVGHVKLSTTKRYTRVREARLLEAMRALDVLLEDL